MAEKQEGGACAEKNKKESDVLVEDEELDDLLDSTGTINHNRTHA